MVSICFECNNMAAERHKFQYCGPCGDKLSEAEQAEKDFEAATARLYAVFDCLEAEAIEDYVSACLRQYGLTE